ncbi:MULTISPECIES: DUF2314 domain-containing protein [Cupriavidus]|uniref:DUF2314 domain-containing protein n=1 Tax=Cupriavidus taiwanensis TaxID=164546 RepID=A0A9Q7UWV3_9BURK|nr:MULTISPECIES: DUF2314 domain-containing protein [Cupriavidus]MEC3768230.1 DUF2314 domain-containing protein [Cupriavidus sp. SS-3]SPD66146.1 conserved protein of unknown function [Cupriavidus taiwanensis]
MDMRLTTLDEDGWELDDAEPIAAAHPDTFWLPPRAERDALAAGQQVKLIFRILVADEGGNEEVHVERMWVNVTGREGALYTGELDNQPYCTDEMNPGMPLCFEARHVIHIYREGDEDA